ncbi:hypothetical protein BTH42_12465 [Burkholderia sp. SRS-W-2-2016]|nr:hypothetical protein BTH42_12465 [Burkholderia sp. SRS-W-2-2016]
MDLWRISNYADLRGIGGLRAPGRWHFAGRPVVYLAEHPAVALLETLVHQEIGNPARLPDKYQLLRIEVPDGTMLAEIADGEIPENWRDDLPWTRNAGTEWLNGGSSVLLKVPSAILPCAFNYLMNPAHPDASLLKIGTAIDVRHDPRIMKLLAAV